MAMEPGLKMRIDTLTAFLSIDENGLEGVIAFRALDGTMCPMIGADGPRIESMKPLAEKIAAANGCTVRLARFGVREDLEFFTPGKGWAKK